MKRRDFFSAAAGIGAAGVGAVTVLANSASGAAAERRPAEKRSQVYRCRKCSAIVEIIMPGRPTLVHCGEPMELLPEQTAEKALEKHVPVIEKIKGGYKGTVGSTPHPMTKAHHIVWIELMADGRICRRY